MKLLSAFDFEFAFIAFSSLFSIINPISAAPIFVTMTEGLSRRKAAFRSSMAAAVVLVVFASAGGAIFAFFGITVPAFQIAGGLLFALMSIPTLLHDSQDEEKATIRNGDPSIIPLGFPLIAGPGAISAVMVLVGQAQTTFRILAVAAAIVINVVLTLLTLLAAPWIQEKLGAMGQRIIAKVMGLITVVIGVQFVINGATVVITNILKAAKG